MRHEQYDNQTSIWLIEEGLGRWADVMKTLVTQIFILVSLVILVMNKHLISGIEVAFLIDKLWGINWQLRSFFECLNDLDYAFKGFKKKMNYINTKPEKYEQGEVPDAQWPSKGKVEFKDVQLKYRPELKTVLKGLSFSVKPGEKVGIVGRTGAGKSTLCMALCRIVELFKGQIMIDGQDISQVKLNHLRSKITIIAQEPTILKGSLRYNLDPKNQRSDEELLEMIEKAEISSILNRSAQGLDQDLDCDGTNLSTGEQQLISICRAILNRNKVVLMDEATANIDIKTERIIQRLIHDEFKDSTVLTIAHRLNTIINSDKVLVMSDGRAVEFDAPQTLLKQGGQFAKLAKDIKQEEQDSHNL